MREYHCPKACTTQVLIRIKQTQFPDPERSPSDAALVPDDSDSDFAIRTRKVLRNPHSDNRSETLQKHYRYSSGEITNLNLKAQRSHFDDPDNATRRALLRPVFGVRAACRRFVAGRKKFSHASDKKTIEELEATRSEHYGNQRAKLPHPPV
ncbi:MAG: hypothetical protein ACR2IE_01830 [Candidatus Sumerlaeaceae bacterium]